MTVRVISGDCVERMRELPAESVDAVVTDPPYHLAFMSKAWDTVTPGQSQHEHERWAREALRVLKPGGHLLAFGGTRTVHRLAAGIEDAGFEIRDTIAWMYGSGFPKSLDVGKAIDKRPGVSRQAAFAAHLAERREAAGLSRPDLAQCIVGTRSGAVRNWELYGQWPEAKWWPALRDLLGLDESWGPVIAEAEREKVGTNPNVERSWRSSSVSYEVNSGSADITAPRTPEAQAWEGWGTALKPAHEPIVVARKPLSGTVAGNVLEFGTGALHIDATRIGRANGDRTDYGLENGADAGIGYHGLDGRTPYDGSAGRWPANVVLSHSAGCVPVGTRRVKTGNSGGIRGFQTEYVGGEAKDAGLPNASYADADGLETVTAWECVPGCPVRLLDEQTGTTRSANGTRDRTGGSELGQGSGWNAHENRPTSSVEYGDSGGASRFFANFEHRPEPGDLTRAMYVAKASSSERAAGLPDHIKASHPTCKPVELMRWLIRLVCPPDGTILDPFLGSGTTLCAALLEPCVGHAIGIEREPEYIALAEARIAWWAEHPDGMELVKRLEAEREQKTVRESGQGSLFDV